MLQKYGYRLTTAALYMIFCGLMILSISKKVNYHCDEIFSYGLSNHQYEGGSVSMKVKKGKTYKNPEKPYLNYITVKEENRFDYPNVWENQKNDVHPPLYYAILHTICSFFPGKFSPWYAGWINIVFLLMTLFLFQKLVLYLSGDEKVSLLFSVAFVLCSGVLSSATFLRMYAMTTFWAVLQAYLFVLLEKKFARKRLLGLFFATVFSALTHYYCIIYVVLISVVFGVILLFRKQWKKLAVFCGVMAGAAAVSIAIFPSMIEHMFFGYRGEESINNLKNGADYVTRLKYFGDVMDKQLFGGMLVYLFVFGVIAFIYSLIRAKSRRVCKRHELFSAYMLLIIPLIIFFLLVAKMAVYTTDRYLFPVYALAMAVVLCMVDRAASTMFPYRIKIVLFCVLLAVMTFGNKKGTDWGYLYKSTEPVLASAQSLSDVDCICLYSYRYEMQYRYKEISNYKSVTFLDADDLSKLPDYKKECRELVVIVISDDPHEQHLQAVMEKYPALTQYETLPNYGLGASYYLSSAE